jgi:hypothetical protein
MQDIGFWRGSARGSLAVQHFGPANDRLGSFSSDAIRVLGSVYVRTTRKSYHKFSVLGNLRNMALTWSSSATEEFDHAG